jgi:type II secretion system protein I
MYLPTRPATPRRGLSLLEVLVALAIFLLSFVAIGRLVSLASDQAVEVQYQSQATRLAQSKMNEVLAGAVPLQYASGNFDEDQDWEWKVEAEQNSQVPNLWTVTVTVTRPSHDGDEISSSLTHMILDPSARGTVFDTVSVTGASDTAPSTSASSASSSGAQDQQAQQTPAAAANPTKPTTKTPTPAPKTPTPTPTPAPKAPTPAPKTKS